jgi:uncharacterized protein (DUF58 family)
VQQNRVRWSFTGNAVAFIAVMVAMWYAGSSQQNSAAYLLLFGLTSIGVISIPHALFNVRGLSVRAEAIKPAFAGQEATLPVEVTNGSRANRKGLRLHLPQGNGSYENLDDLPAGKATRATLRFPVLTRGEHTVDAVCLESTYPLGLMRVVKRVAVTPRYIVYPKPSGDSKLPVSNRPRGQTHSRPESAEGDDFAGVRAYVPGESQRHIDWKAVARGQELMTKQFTGESDSGLLYLDLVAARSGDVESRLSQLALWIIEAERTRRPYGLRLPKTEIAPSLGEMHFHRCLRMLALHK